MYNKINIAEEDKKPSSAKATEGKQETDSSEQETENHTKRDLASPDNQPGAASREPASPAGVPEAGSSKGMSSGAKWGIGLGACCCCLIIVILVVLILGFAGCSMFQFGGLGRYNWPAAPTSEEGTPTLTK